MEYKKPSEEFKDMGFGDKRIDRRMEKSVEMMSKKSEESILSSCITRHDAKGFYAMLGNDKFSFEQVSDRSRKETIKRIIESGVSEVLLPQDTTNVNMNGHKKTEGLGYCSEYTKGVQVHSCLALMPDGTNLGLVAQQYGTREQAKQEESKEDRKKRTIEDKESYRWLETVREAKEAMPENVRGIIICDREGDFYELYADMLTLETMFIVRMSQDRAMTEDMRAMQQIRRTQACGEMEMTIPRDTRANTKARTAKMEVAYCTVAVAKPKRVRADVPKQLVLTLVRVTEIVESGEGIEWLLVTNMPVESPEEAMKIVEYYAHRWKIERFHYILKSGCQVEKIQQRTYDRILPVLLIYSVIAAFILAVTYFARSMPDAPCDLFLADDEWKILYRLVTRDPNPPAKPYSIKTAVDFLGELGSFKHAPSDGDYGVKSVWKGLLKLFDALDFLARLTGQV